jgi:homoserine O-acetyltransferase
MTGQGRARARGGRLWRWLAGSPLPLLLPAVLGCTPSQQVAALGDFPLESGEVIHDCRVGYRTQGRLDAARSNAVLLIPWFMGTSGQIARQIGPGRLVDSSRHFVVAVDPLGNGVSSSPSNSPRQAGAAFPRFSMRDQVELQRRLLSSVLGIQHLEAVVGVSMGGMLTFQWITAYPDFMDRAVAIVGTPRFPPGDAPAWRAHIEAVKARTPAQRAWRALLAGELRGAFQELQLDGDDHMRQAQAMIGLDVSGPYGGSMERAAAAVRSRLLVMVSPTDDVVKPQAARDFAHLAGAQLIELDGRCGHQAPSCQRREVSRAVEDFLRP